MSGPGERSAPRSVPRTPFTAAELEQASKFLKSFTSSQNQTVLTKKGAVETEIPAYNPSLSQLVPPTIPEPSQNGVRSERSRPVAVDPQRTAIRPRSQSQPKSLSARSRKTDRQRHSSSGGFNLVKAARSKQVQSAEPQDYNPETRGFFHFIKEGAPAENGVVNDGVLCYAIVLVQSLLGTNAFARLAILDNVNWIECSPITANLILVLRLLWLNQSSSCEALKDLVYKIAARHNEFSCSRQQDVLEFLTLLLGELLLGNVDSFNVHQNYARKCFKDISSGQLVYTSKCANCSYQRTDTEDFTSLSLPLPTETHPKMNIYAVVQENVYMYGLRIQETALANDIVECLSTDSQISQRNCAMLAYDRDCVKVFEPNHPLRSSMESPMYTAVQLPSNAHNPDLINAIVFVRDRCLRAPFLCSLNMESSVSHVWRRISEAVFRRDEGVMPLFGEVDVRIAVNSGGSFDIFSPLESTRVPLIQSRNCFWPQNTTRPFIVLTVDIRFIRKPFVVKAQKEHQHASYFANMGPSIDKLLTNYFKEETVSFVCRMCKGTKLKRSAHMERSPQVLFLHLNRFAQDNSETVKVNSKVSVPRDSLDLAPYFKAEHTMHNQRYHLCAVISHLGSTVSSGHYQCYRRNPVTGKWRIFSDSHVYSYNFPEHMTSTSAYFLIYEKITPDSEAGQRHWFRNMYPEQLRRNVRSALHKL